ncbi:TPA: hypothetical protein ACIYBJ_004963, partial [Escherichia coli]|uniref:hypothetical protein n=2 Tax=Escherichia coli TaxID=562 RepID=UPI0038B66629
NTAKHAIKTHDQKFKKHITTNNIINYKLALSGSKKNVYKANTINLYALIQSVLKDMNVNRTHYQSKKYHWHDFYPAS